MFVAVLVVGGGWWWGVGGVMVLNLPIMFFIYSASKWLCV